MNPRNFLRRVSKAANALFLSVLPCLALTGPQLTVQGPRGEKAPLAIESFQTEVLFFDDLAETTITITFRNPSNRVIEGEFAIPLPPDSTVSGYALDVNGRMRESSVVEKERARFAYESIKSQMIDPGFIEREEGNVYRTKIFPIPAKGTKAVRLSYCETLDPSDAHLTYCLPLPTTQIEKINFTLEHAAGKTLNFPDDKKFVFTNPTKGKYQATASNYTLPQKLEVRINRPKEEAHFVTNNLSYRRTKTIETPLLPKDCETIEIVWDRSESGSQRDHAKEWKFLEELFQKHPTITVILTFLDLKTEAGGTFQIKNGNWKKLRKTLESTFYDGATDLSAFQSSRHHTLLFTDGQSHFSSLTKKWSAPVTMIDSNGNAAPYWKSQAQNYRDLKRGKTLTKTQRNFTKNSKSTRGTRKIKDPRIAKIITTLWAQQELRSLEAAFVPNRKEIIAHCKAHHLVSDETSLIVLERFEDYVRYEIPPPEKALLALYEKRLKRNEREFSTQKIIAELWKKRTRWHHKTFPWRERLLYPRLKRLSIWKDALLKTFAPEELNQKTLNDLTTWQKEAVGFFKHDKSFRKKTEHQAWLAKLDELNQTGKSLDELTFAKRRPDGKIAIAVNGFVTTPGKIVSDDKLTLLKAIEKADGIDHFGSAARVAIYRNGGKAIYNTLSEQFTDFPLEPGDMIVVEQEHVEDNWDSDPFAESNTPDEAVDHSKAPAVVSDFGDFNDSSMAVDIFGDGEDPFGGTPEEEGSGLVLPPIGDSPEATWIRLKNALTDSKESPESLYQKLRPKTRASDQFYLEAGELLLDLKKPDLARRVLSNLIETPIPNPAAYRKWAYLLAKHSDWQSALDILKKIARHYPNDQAIALDLAWIAGHLDKPQFKRLLLEDVVNSLDPKSPSSKNLAEFAAAELSNSDPNHRLAPKLPLDLRIVVSNASGKSLSIFLTDPFGPNRFSPWQKTSSIGGRISESAGISEYALRRAIPGTYRIHFSSKETEIIRLHIYRDWGKPTQSLDEKILLIPASPSWSVLATYEFELE